MLDWSSFEKSVQSLSREELARIVVDQAQAMEFLRQRIGALERQLDDEQRKPPRSAAPFRIPESKRKGKTQRKKPGRKKGHPGAYRSIPDQIDETIEAPLCACPCCGGGLSGVAPIEQFIEELPEIRPRVTRLVTYAGHCARCGDVHSTHPLQVSTACGAAAVQLGPRAQGAAMELLHTHHLTRRKTCAVLKQMFGLRLSPGGLTQMAHRMAGKLTDAYEGLLANARQAALQHVDETSWWVGGPKWWLWVFAHPTQTLYRVCDSRGREVLCDTLSAQYPGVLISDCLNIYDEASPTQHKCYAHHLKAISQAIEKHPRGGQGFLRQARAALLQAMALKKTRDALDPAQYAALRQSLEQNTLALIAAPRGDPLEESIANRLRKQQDHLFTFLDYDQVQATNNLAERQLRPAVIARKISCGNKTPRGARTWEILASLAATAKQNQNSLAQLIHRVTRLDLRPATR
jgi:transposase